MKKTFLAIIAGAAVVTAVFIFTPASSVVADISDRFLEREPDIPEMLANAKSTMTKEEFLEERANGHALLRGLGDEEPVDPQMRISAIKDLEEKQERQQRMPESAYRDALLANWTAIGPAPIIAQAVNPNNPPRYSGRVISIAVHPTNPDIVYAGAAQGGLYRSTNGGTSWTPIMDNALSLAIGAIAISPSNPETVYVGTGEPNFAIDSFFGVGVYRIENASTTATLVGPLNRDAIGTDLFTGRSVSEIIVHPTDNNTIFVSTTTGFGGLGGVATSPLPARGIYRSTNAAGAAPVFTRLTGLAGNIDASIRDIAIDPGNPDILVAGMVAGGPTGGIYRTTNALSAAPTFTQVRSYTGTSTSDLTTEFAAIRPAGAPDAIFYAASGQGTGTVLRSNDGGATWTQQVDNNFCNPQCFYNIAIATDVTNPDRVYLGGSPTLVAGLSTNGGTSFTESGGGVHVDTQALAVAPSNPAIIYLGTDGGIYKSTNSGASYTHLNTSEFSATQFMGLSVHPTDPNFTLGGTQDNGTNFLDPGATAWNMVRGGDGGYSVIDTNAADTTNVRMYHTFFNRVNSLVGYETRGTTTATWTFRGCGNGTTPNNGINCNDTTTLFYAPLEQGPGNPNTIYYGTDRIYRSNDLGLTHTVVSQAPITSGVAVSAIGISPQDDNFRIFGLRTGGLFGTTTGSSAPVDLDPLNTVPSGFVARAVFDPTNTSTAYVTLASFGVNNVYKTTNFNSGAPVWVNISGTLPRVPVSAFIVDPANPEILYAGTDIGVYVSPDGGTTWEPFGTGFPRVAVFDMAKAGGNTIRIATHGRGMWQIPAFSPNAIPITISGRVATPSGQGLRNAQVALIDALGVRRIATTSSFGIYAFADVTPGSGYIVSVASKRYRFTAQTLNITTSLNNVDFVGLE